MGAVRTRPLPAAFVALTIAFAACTGGGSSIPTPTARTGSLAASVASSDLYAGTPQRFLLGMLHQDAQGVKFLTGGELPFAFSYLGADGGASPEPGPEATGSYIPAPGTPDAGNTEPTLTAPSEGRGVYQAEDVTFDRAGIWRVTTEADGETLTADFGVTDEPQLPAPGEPAPASENLTVDRTDVDPSSIDSRALQGAAVPDPELHSTTVAAALDTHSPILLVLATPTYCTSQLCGPDVEVVERLAANYVDRATFIHIEVWEHYPDTISDAAKDWLEPVETEPWMWLIGSDGTIVDRWGPVWSVDEVEGMLADLPPLR